MLIETMKLLGSTKKDVDKDKDGENVPKLESVKGGLVHYNLVKNDYEHTFLFQIKFLFQVNNLNKQFGQTNISPHSLTMMNAAILDFRLLKFGAQMKLVKHLKLKIMLINAYHWANIKK